MASQSACVPYSCRRLHCLSASSAGPSFRPLTPFSFPCYHPTPPPQTEQAKHWEEVKALKDSEAMLLEECERINQVGAVHAAVSPCGCLDPACVFVCTMDTTCIALPAEFPDVGSGFH